MLKDLRTKEFTEKEARLLNPLQLALVGDGVYELFIRNSILSNNLELSAHKMHVKAIGYVKAKSQSIIMHEIEDKLTENESYIFKRGRNAHTNNIPKNATYAEYHKATGFEALFGYLYLKGDIKRLKELFSLL